MSYPIGQHFICGFEGTTVTRKLETLIQKHRIGGVVLFARNIESPHQVRELTKKLKRLSQTPLFVCVDQEGGLVRRFREPFTPLPPMAVVGKYYQKTRHIRTLLALGRLLGQELAAVGVNWDFAPVVDVHSNPKNPVIGNRSFGPNPRLVGLCAGALMKGLHDEGVLSCAKHFPGHGATSSDSHLTLPRITDPGRLLWRRDLYPFRKLIAGHRILTVMTAHVKYRDLDKNFCATLSEKILVDLLRRRMKFDGVIVSDDLRMKGITKWNNVSEAALLFFRAGGDMALICRDTDLQGEAMEYLQKVLPKDKNLAAHLMQSSARINHLAKRFCRSKTLPPLSVIGCRRHLDIVSEILSEA